MGDKDTNDWNSVPELTVLSPNETIEVYQKLYPVHGLSSFDSNVFQSITSPSQGFLFSNFFLALFLTSNNFFFDIPRNQTQRINVGGTKANI